MFDFTDIIDAIQSGLSSDVQATAIRAKLSASPPPSKSFPYTMSEDGTLLLLCDRIYVPDLPSVKLKILRALHDHPLSGHPGVRKTLQHIRRHYYWPRLTSYVQRYVCACSSCRRAKSSHHRPYGPLRFLPTPLQPWESISMDHIEGLPMSSGYDTILVIVCHLTKMALFIATRATDTSEDLAQLYLHHVFSKHGAPSDIVSDRGKTFVSDFWSSLCRLLHIKRNLSTAYHPETDGQTECLNQILEQYLRIYSDSQNR